MALVGCHAVGCPTQTANLSPKDKTFNNGTNCLPGTLAEAK